MRKILAGAATALFLLGGPAAAQFAEWDADGDGRIAFDEFGDAFDSAVGAFYHPWDIGGDNVLDAQEYYHGIFGIYDENADGAMDLQEFAEGHDAHGYGAFSDYDFDDSGTLSSREFRTGVFSQYDVDDDRMWDEEEYGLYEADSWGR